MLSDIFFLFWGLATLADRQLPTGRTCGAERAATSGERRVPGTRGIMHVSEVTVGAGRAPPQTAPPDGDATTLGQGAGIYNLLS